MLKTIIKWFKEESLTGVKEYDNLPSRVGFMDIDARRFSYIKALNNLNDAKKDLDWAVERFNNKK